LQQLGHRRLVPVAHAAKERVAGLAVQARCVSFVVPSAVQAVEGDPQKEVGFTYNLARWRDGFRFASADSYGGSINDPLSFHKYLYAGADPSNRWDPSGHEFSVDELITNIGISNFIGKITAPIIKPVASYLANSLLPAGFLQKLQASLPNAYVFQTPFNGSFTEGNEIGISGTVGVGAEVAVGAKSHNLALYGFAYAGLTDRCAKNVAQNGSI
jgi:hypothetical protein